MPDKFIFFLNFSNSVTIRFLLVSCSTELFASANFTRRLWSLLSSDDNCALDIFKSSFFLAIKSISFFCKALCSFSSSRLAVISSRRIESSSLASASFFDFSSFFSLTIEKVKKLQLKTLPTNFQL
jgi:hypothetical protein